MSATITAPIDITAIWGYAIEPDLALSLLTGGLRVFLDPSFIESPGKIIIYGCEWDDDGDRISGHAALLEADVEPELAVDTFWGWAEIIKVIEYDEDSFKQAELEHGCGNSLERFLELRNWPQAVGYYVEAFHVANEPVHLAMGPENRGFFKTTQIETMQIFKRIITESD